MKSNVPARRTRLLVLTSTFPRRRDDGEPGFVLELATRLAGQFDITVLVPHAPGLSAKENWGDLAIHRFRYAPAPLETLAYQGGIQAQLRAHPWKHLLVPFFLLSQWWHCRKLLRNDHFNTIHAHWIFPQGLIALVCGNVPVIVTAHGSDLHGLRGRFWRHIQRYVLGRSRVVATVSRAMADIALAIQRPINDLRILPMGVDLQSRFTPADMQRASATFLFVGRLVASKGLDVLLEAFSLLLRDQPDSWLVVVGSGPNEDDYKTQARSLGIADRVEFTGALPANRLPARYRQATALVSPSRAEGLGLTLIEAAGCACPIIATDLPATREILVDGESGLLVPPDTPQSLANAMRQLATERGNAERLGKNARAAVLTRYDWPAVADAYAAAIRHIAATAHAE